jgi:protein tyrosine phosphatase
MVVGCSAGIGRTGSFIAICSLLGGAGVKERDWKAQEEATTRGVALPNTPGLELYSEDLVVTEIDWLREQRGGMVQKREQMELIYRVLDLSTE